MAEPTILAGNTEFQITFHESDRKHETLIVTFAGQPGQLSDRGFGTGFALSRGYDTVYVGQRYETHFQGLDIATFQTALANVANGRRVICYGSSLGAYAALYYGGSVDAEILAGAPMLPSWTVFDRPQYRDFMRSHLPLAEVPKGSHRPIILTDPKEVNDIKYMQGEVRPAFPEAEILEFPYAGHTVLRTIDAAKKLSPSVLEMFETGTFPDLTLPTHGFGPWHMNFGGEQLRQKNWDDAYYHAKAAFDLERSEGQISLMMRVYRGQGKFAQLISFVTDELSDQERTRFIEGSPGLKRVYDTALAAVK